VAFIKFIVEITAYACGVYTNSFIV